MILHLASCFRFVRCFSVPYLLICVYLSIWHPNNLLSREQDRLRSYPHKVCTVMRDNPGALWQGPTSLSLLVA